MGFQFTRGPLDGMVLVQPEARNDQRGFFLEAFRASTFAAAGIVGPFVQENQSQSHLGVLRGIHYQSPPWAQGKLIRVLEGKIWDLAVDLRPDSPTLGWAPTVSFDQRLERTIRWYLDHQDWVAQVSNGEHQTWVETNDTGRT